jgi:hypothetical protein
MCYRKAALCHIEHGEFATATVIMQKCSKEEAASHYIMYLAAVKQGEFSLLLLNVCAHALQ